MANYNINNGNEFYTHMLGLSKFASNIRDLLSCYRDLKPSIYYEVIHDFNGAQKKYYLIEDNGFCHAYCYSPNNETDNAHNPNKYSVDQRSHSPYYGISLLELSTILKNGFEYDVVDSMGDCNKDIIIQPTIEDVRNNFCPLITKSNNLVDNDKQKDFEWYRATRQPEINKYGDIIYKNPIRSFYLPLIDLFLEYTQEHPYYITTKTYSPHPKYFDCHVYIAYSDKKYAYDRQYYFRASYTEFEIIQCRLVDSKQQYIG